MERYVWRAHPYVAYTMVDKLFNPFTLLVGPCLVAVVMYKSTLPIDQGGYRLPWWNILASWFVWLLATRTLKLMPHLWHRPQDIIHVPAFILFGYYFAIMKLYALCTLHETGWGTRAGIGDASAATAAMDNLNTPQQEKGLSPYAMPMQQPVPQSYNAQPFNAHPDQQLSQRIPHVPQVSPFADNQFSYEMDSPQTPIYASRSRSQRRGGDHDEEMEMQVGFAR